MRGTPAVDIEQYVADFPQEVQKRLNAMLKTIRKAAPAAVGAISYQMPAFKLEGRPLVYLAAYAHHIGFYPGAAITTEFKNDIAGFKSAKGSVQFPHEKPLPLALITKIVKYRVKQNVERAKKKPAARAKR